MYKYILYEENNGIGLAKLNRPEQRNALCNDMVEELDKFLGDIEKSDSVKAIIITGAGEKAFMAGADINELNERDFIKGRMQSKRRQEVYNRISDLPIVTIAAINGYALGAGLELALACTIRISSENGKFGSPEVNLGIIPGDGATQRLSRIIGMGRAMDMVLTGEIIDAKIAYQYGLITKVFPSSELINQAESIAQTIMKKAPLAVYYGKEAVSKSLDTSLAVGLNIESYLHALCCASKDKKEGVNAFLEKRKPKFLGQ